MVIKRIMRVTVTKDLNIRIMQKQKLLSLKEAPCSHDNNFKNTFLISEVYNVWKFIKKCNVETRCITNYTFNLRASLFLSKL